MALLGSSTEKGVLACSFRNARKLSGCGHTRNNSRVSTKSKLTSVTWPEMGCRPSHRPLHSPSYRPLAGVRDGLVLGVGRVEEQGREARRLQALHIVGGPIDLPHGVQGAQCQSRLLNEVEVGAVTIAAAIGSTQLRRARPQNASCTFLTFAQ